MKVTRNLVIVAWIALHPTVHAEDARAMVERHPEWGSYLSLKELSQEAWHQDRGLGERISAAIDRGDLRVALNQFAIWSADKFAAEAKKDSPRRHIQEMHLRNLGAVSTAYFLMKSGRITEERPRVPQTVENEDSFTSGYYEGLFDELIGHGKLIEFGTPEDFIWGRRAGQAVAAKALSSPRIDKPNKAEQNDR